MSDRAHTLPPIQSPPPYSQDAEMGVLGSMIMSREAIGECMDRLSVEHFYSPPLQTVFSVLCELYERGTPIDLITFTNELRDRKILESVGGAPGVTALFTFVPTAANVLYYIDIVQDKFMARTIIAKCTECVRAAYDDQAEIAEVLEHTQAALTQIIIQSQQKETIRHVSEGEEAAYKSLERAWKHRGDQVIAGIATNFYDLDRMTTGLMPGQMVVLGARPSQGKTSLALNFAANIALTNKSPVGLFSLEMSYEQIWQRLLSYHSRISRQRWRDGFLSGEEDLPVAKVAAAEVSKAKLWIDDTPNLSVHQFRARARLMKIRFGVQVIVVDYVQIMAASKVRGGKDPRIEVNEISATLKSVAKELGIVVIACAQLNRNVEEREFGKPRMSDLKESGALEQDADCVAMLWRPVMHLESRYHWAKLAHSLKLKGSDGKELFTLNEKTGKLAYDQTLTIEQEKERNQQIQEYAELILVKQRDGPVGNIRLRFLKDLTRFENVTTKEWSNNPEERQGSYESKPKPKPAPPAELAVAQIKEVFPGATVIQNGEDPF